MNKKTWITPILTAACLSCFSVSGWAQVSSTKLTVNSINNDKITAVTTFGSAITGDLWVAAKVGENFLFVQPNNNFTFEKKAFLSNTTFNSPITVIDNYSSAGLAPGKYPLYQVIMKPGATDPLNTSNWIGGIAGLSVIQFSINENNTPVVTAVPTAVPTPEPTATPVADPTPAPASSGGDGRSLYVSKGCSDSQCHRDNPKDDFHGIMTATNLNSIKNAIRNNPSEMGYLGKTSDPRFATDAELQAIVSYIKSL